MEKKSYLIRLVKEKAARYDIDKRINSPKEVWKIATEILQLQEMVEEVFSIITLSNKNEVIGLFEVSRGTLDSSLVHPREVFKLASIILLHNHPSGDTKPSPEDIKPTKVLILTLFLLTNLCFRVIYSINQNTERDLKMQAIFIRKVINLEELKELTDMDLKIGREGVSYEITKEVKLSDKEFKKFTENFLKEQPWITEGEDGGMNRNGQIRCIRVKNKETGEKILVNSEGYTYSRYTALELD